MNGGCFSQRTFKPYLAFSKPSSPDCYQTIKTLLWINNQPFWTYYCAGCQAYKFEKGKIPGGIHD